jgi:cytochrome c peroxidase
MSTSLTSKMSLTFALAAAVLLAPSIATGQAATTFGSASGVSCPGGNVICNGSINFLTTELFFEPETPPAGLKDSLVTWNEIEYLLDNPYATGGWGNPANVGAPCTDGSGAQPTNEQGFPTYCTPTTGLLGNEFSYVRRPAFGVTHAVRTGAGAAGDGGSLSNVAGLPPLRVHPLNYNAPTGGEQRLLNPNFGGGAFEHRDVCYTLGAFCVPPSKMINVSAGTPRLDPSDTPEINYDVSIGRKLAFCQQNPEPVPLNAPFNTSFDSENLTACGSDPGEPGAARIDRSPGPLLGRAARCMSEAIAAAANNPNLSLASYLCEDNLGLPYRNLSTTSWYSVPAVPAGSPVIAAARQVPYAGTGLLTGSAIPIQLNEHLVDPGARGDIQRYDPVSGKFGLKKPSLRSADVGGNGYSPNYLVNTNPNDTVPSNENDYFGLYNGNGATGNYYSQKQAARLEAARLGKALFWDMQVGSDGVQSCGSCHAHAGADNRTKNQINPFGQDGISGNPTNSDTSGALASFTFQPNHDLTQSDYPFHKLANPDIAGDPVCGNPIVGNVAGITFPDGDPPDHPLTPASYTACAASNIVSDTDDVASSMGVHFGRFLDIPAIGAPSFGPGSAVGGVKALVPDLRSTANNPNTGVPDSLDPLGGFAGQDGSGHEFRRVEPRNTPTIFLAQFNFDNFWDGRARHDDNGGSVFGPSDPQAHVFVDQGNGLTATRQLIKFSSIASLAKGPALSKFEMSFDGRNWPKIGKKLLQAGVTPLANQLVAPDDSILGPYSNQNGSRCASLPAGDRSPAALGAGVPGLCITYNALIRHAFYSALWQNTLSHLDGCYTDGRPDLHPNQCGNGSPAASIETLDPDGTVRAHNNDPFDGYVLNINGGAADATDTNQFTQMEGNFSLFWGQSISAWASLLVPDATPFDQFMDINPDAGMATAETGEPLLVLDIPMCTNVTTTWTPNGSGVVAPPYVRDFDHAGCLREVGNFKRDPYNPNDKVGSPAAPVQNDTAGHPRMTACISQLTFNGETGTRSCTQRVPAGGTRGAGSPDPLLGMDIFFGSNLSLKNPQFRSARCGACHNAPTLTDHTTQFTHKWTLVDAAAEFAHDNPLIEPLMEPLSKLRIISGFHLEDETNGPGQDAIERKIANESIVPAPVVNNNGNCTTASCSGYSFPDAITVNANATGYNIHSDLGIGPIAGPGAPTPFTSFGGAFFDNGVYNIGVRPCVFDYQGDNVGACDDIGRGGNDAFGWPLSLATLLMKNLGGTAQKSGTALPTFNTSAGGTGGLFELTGHDQQINPGSGDDAVSPQLPAYLAPFASRVPVGDSHPQLDEACGAPVGCPNTLSDVANAEGFSETPFDPRADLSEVINSAFAAGDGTLGGTTAPNPAEQGTWPVVNRVNRFGSFKAPQLREVELTGPYFHNGGKLTLRQVVDFYVRGGDFPVTNSANRDFNILNLNAELQSDLSEHEKVALVDFLLELTDPRVKYERGPFDHPELILPLDGTAPENGNFNGLAFRDAQLTGCVASPLGPGHRACTGTPSASGGNTATGPLFLDVPAVGNGGTATAEPNFLGISSSPRLVGGAANCAVPNNQYCH